MYISTVRIHKKLYLNYVYDITKQKHLEENIKLERERAEKYFESANTIFLILDKEGCIKDINKKGCDVLGYSKKDIIRKNWFDNYIPQLNTEEIKNVFEKITSGEIENLEYYENPIVTEKGEERIISWYNNTIRDGSGEVSFIVSTGTDVTEQRKSEESLIESENRFRIVYEKSPIAKSITKISGELDVNTAFCEMTGYTKKEIEGKKFQDITHPDDIEKSNKVVDDLLNNKTDTVNFEKRYIKKDGSIIWAEVSVTVNRDKKGKPLYFITVINDITDRLLAERKLKKSEAKYRSLFDNLSVGVTAHEIIYGENNKPVNYKITELNRMALKILNLRRNEVLGKLATEIYNGDTPYIDIYVKAAETGNPYQFETYYERMDKYFDITVYSIQINTFITIFTDITGSKKAEKERVTLEAHLRSQQRLESIGTLASGVAHEINNPINGILNYSQIIFESDIGDKNIKKYASEIITETERVAEIVKNLLEFSRQKQQHHSYAKIEDIISKTLSLINTVLRHDQIEMIVDIAEDIPKIKCRSQQLQQVIMNLVTNARDALNEKYSGYDENKKINLSCSHYTSDGRNWTKIVIEDFGAGISEDIRPNIFDPFFTTKKRTEGTGLGLSISYGIVKDHHGEMTVESETGKFTRFIVDLPCD